MTLPRLLNNKGVLRTALVAFSIFSFGVLAQPATGQTPTPKCNTGDFGEFEAPIGTLRGDICEYLKQTKTPLITLFSTIANLLMGIILATGVMMVVAAGYFYMTAGGSAEQVSKAKKMIVAALLGIILALASFMILNAISPQFTPTSTTPIFSYTV